MKLEELLGDELYSQVKAKLDEANKDETDKTKHIRYADLSEGQYVSKTKMEAAEAEKEGFKEQVNKLKETISTLQKENGDNEGLQETIRKLNEDIRALKKENEDRGKEYALKEQLTQAGVTDPDYLVYKAGGIGSFTFDKEGRPVGVEDAIRPYRENTQMAHLFKSEARGSGYQPKQGEGSPVDNPFAKDTFNLTQQGKMFQENPALARELAAAAGIKI